MKERTRRQALLQLVGLVGVLQDKGVDEALAADLELDLLGVAVALDAGSCALRRRTVSFNVEVIQVSCRCQLPNIQPGAPTEEP